MKIKEKLLLLLLPLLLAGCGAHPGSGNWLAGSDEGEFVRLEVNFEGWAQLYAKGSDDAVRRCFWSGASSEEILLKCTVPDNTDIEFSYRFSVTGSGQGELTLADQVIGRFEKQPE